MFHSGPRAHSFQWAPLNLPSLLSPSLTRMYPKPWAPMTTGSAPALVSLPTLRPSKSSGCSDSRFPLTSYLHPETSPPHPGRDCSCVLLHPTLPSPSAPILTAIPDCAEHNRSSTTVLPLQNGAARQGTRNAGPAAAPSPPSSALQWTWYQQ